MKRLFDILVSLLALVLLLPVLVLLWIAVVLHDGLPGLFRQQRVGRGGHSFELLKFRTMTVKEDASQGSFDAGGTTRITPVGRFLRKWKLDELPQLWNVLCGDMSLVGPRPEVRAWVDAYPQRWSRVLTVRPGITDPAAIVYRNEEELLAAVDDAEAHYRDEILPRKLALYEQYIRTRSFPGDLRLLFRTVKTVVWSPRK